jgi:hypothetical protein
MRWFSVLLAIASLTLAGCDSGDGGTGGRGGGGGGGGGGVDAGGGGGDAGSSSGGTMTCDTLNFMANSESPLGVWDLVDWCFAVETNPLEEFCPDSTYSTSMVETDVAEEYRDDGTMSSSGSITLGQYFDLATSCLDADGETCAGTQAMFAAKEEYTSASCVEKAARCACDLIRTPMSQDGGTLWKTEGGLLSTQSDGEWGEGRHYMVDSHNLIVKVVTEDRTVYRLYHKQ